MKIINDEGLVCDHSANHNTSRNSSLIMKVNCLETGFKVIFINFIKIIIFQMTKI